MFTLALMTAVSTAPATPQFDGFFRDLFRGDCHGSCSGSCSGSCTGRNTAADADRRSGCSGSCSGGCNGGLFHGAIRNFFENVFDPKSSCHGSCHGSCRGSSCNGNTRPTDRDPYREPYRDPLPDRRPASTGCTGCTGGVYAGGGCGGGFGSPLYLGSCFGSSPSSGCFGGGVGGYDFAPATPAGFGGGCCDGGAGPVGVPGGGAFGLPPLGSPLQDYNPIPNPNVPLPRTMPGPGDPFDNPARPEPAGGSVRYKKTPDDDADDSRRGRVVVKVPAGAKVFVEGRPLSVNDGERGFVTPPLPADRAGVYTFKVEWTRDGDSHSQTKKVAVRPGETTRLELADGGLVVVADALTKPIPPISTPPADPRKLLPEVPAGPSNPTLTAKAGKQADEVPTVKPPQADVAKITVKLPAGAVLYVNGGKNARSESVREFTTPTLAAGKVYAYTLRAEVVRGGLPEYQESKVEFRGGDSLTVDFTAGGETKAAK